MKRTDLPAGGIEFTMTGLLAGLRFIRFPIAAAPPDNTVGFVNNAQRQTGAIYRDCQWHDVRKKPLKWEPTHWTVMIDEEDRDDG